NVVLGFWVQLEQTSVPFDGLVILCVKIKTVGQFRKKLLGLMAFFGNCQIYLLGIDIIQLGVVLCSLFHFLILSLDQGHARKAEKEQKETIYGNTIFHDIFFKYC